MKCLLNVQGKCRITNELCSNPKELGDEKTCEVYKAEFPKYFERKVVEAAKNIAEYYRENLESPLDHYDPVDLMRNALLDTLSERGLSIVVQPFEDEDAFAVLKKNWSAIVKYADEKFAQHGCDMKCLFLSNSKNCCCITKEPCVNPVYLGEENKCSVYEQKFSEWFTKIVEECCNEKDIYDIDLFSLGSWVEQLYFMTYGKPDVIAKSLPVILKKMALEPP